MDDKHLHGHEKYLSDISLFTAPGIAHERETTIMFTRLLDEHDHIQKTLNLLEIQFLDLCRDRKPDYSMMLSIVVYIQEYPEQAHHPLEDAVYSVLLERLDEVNEVKLIRGLISDHTELEIVTRNLRKSLELVEKGIVSIEKLKQQLHEFLIKQRRHLYIEETKIYPLIKRVITEQDWEDIQAMIPLMDDPVFGARTRNDYELLYREIERKFN